MNNSEKVFLFSSGGVCLGELRPESMDFPWVYGLFLPANSFPEFSKLFERECQLSERISNLEEALEISSSVEQIEIEIDMLERERDEVEEKIDQLNLYIADKQGREKSKVTTLHINGAAFEYK
ncbi:hypothetical protein ACG1BZ_09490 [Microbulbifer sp. CNSA002]|uniref:hypothetical protein n=1 Tax=Microbulbifer sp. CNSA002 TaxID=3373604 RepID=UPI0039B45FFA